MSVRSRLRSWEASRVLIPVLLGAAIVAPFAAFWSPSVMELLTRRPVITLAGLLLAIGLVRLLPFQAALAAPGGDEARGDSVG